MAHVWIRARDDEWQPVVVPEAGCALTGAGPSALDAAADAPGDAAGAVWIRRVSAPDGDTWALLASPSTRLLVNGLPASHGIVILSDRDEIRWSGSGATPGTRAEPLFFSSERLAAVAAYPGEGHRGLCPRCKQPLAIGDPAVRCPGCGLWHHASDALPCWTYGEHCAACSQPTSLDAGFQWTPEDL